MAVPVPATKRKPHQHGGDALAASEARYRALVRALSSLVWATEADGSQIGEMTEWRALTGQTVDEVRGRGAFNALHPDDREHSEIAWKTAVDTQSFYQTEYRIRRWDGEYVWHQARGVPIHNQDGSIREWVGVCVDIEDRKRLRENEARIADERRRALIQTENALQDLRAAQGRLIQTEKLASLGQLTAGIAHEIKNPLNFVNNFSSVSVELMDELQDALKGAQLDAKISAEIAEVVEMLRGNLDKIVQHGKRADSIVKNMLLHSRTESGEHRPVEINAIVEESLNLAYHGARAEKKEFTITLEKNLDPAAGEIDLFPQEITRVFLNVISNGFYAATKRKAESNGDGAYEPTLLAATRNLGDRVEIRIRDNGAGIPPEVKDKMFNPFFTTKPAGEGTGLGLSISHDIIVKQHAGTIEVDTKAGEFTEFRITLPRKAAALGTGA